LYRSRAYDLAMAHESGAELVDLTQDDLVALRLAAQVMAHRAQLAGRPRVGLYFDSLESAVMAEQAARGQEGDRLVSASPLVVPGPEDRRVIGEYLGLLVANPGLSDSVRRVCRALVARDAISPQ
jgi:hypothetical protein